MSTLQTETIVIDTPPVNGLPVLKMVAKHYVRAASTETDPSCRDISLVFMHGLGLTKEQWEPVLEKLWDLAESDGELSQYYRITEVWSPEWQSHGESGILNKALFENGSVKGLAVSVWGTGLSTFIKEGYLRNKRVIVVGFSSGNLAMLHGLREFSVSQSPVIGLVIVEPILFDRETASPDHAKTQVQVEATIKGLRKQAESWRDRDEARQYLIKRLPWSLWDKTIFENYMQYGLTEFTDADGKQAVKTICSRAEEVSVYENYEDTWSAMAVVEQLSPSIPIHVVFGAKDRFIPREWKACAVDVSKGRKVAGVHMANANHMVPQEIPGDFAKLISQLIRDIVRSPLPKL